MHGSIEGGRGQRSRTLPLERREREPERARPTEESSLLVTRQVALVLLSELVRIKAVHESQEQPDLLTKRPYSKRASGIIKIAAAKVFFKIN